MRSTRTRIGPLAVVLALGAVAACGGDDGGGSGPEAVSCEVGETDGPLRMFNWTDYIDEEQVAEFAEEFGIDYSIDSFESNESMQGLVSAGNSNFNLVVPSDYMVAIMAAGGHLLPLDHDAIPNLSNIDPDFDDPAYDPGLAHSVPYLWGYTGLGVDTSVLGDDFPRSWSLVFGPEADEFSGRITLLNDAREALGAALAFLGYSPNTTSQDELDEAADLLSSALDNIIAFEVDAAAAFLVSGETVIGQMYSGGFATAVFEVDNPDDYEFFVPEEGGVRWVDNFAIPFDAPAPCTAHTFINWMLQGEQHAWLADWSLYGAPNTAAAEFLDEFNLAVVSPDRLAGPPELVVGLLDTGDFEIQFSDAFIRAKG